MDTKLILQSLERTDAIEDFLLAGAPLVGPGAVISNDLEWSTEFNRGRALFLGGEYKSAAQAFCELDKALPQHDRILTPAKINEFFCWLKLGEFEKYIEKYEPLLKENRIYGLVLWQLALAYFRTGNIINTELCLRQWVQSPVPQLLAKGCLLVSLLQVRNHKMDDAIIYFNQAWETDKDFCERTIMRYLGSEAGKTVLESAASVESSEKEPQVVAKEEVISDLERLLIPRGPGKYPQVTHQLSEFEYQAGYISALERFGDGDVDEALRLIDSLLKGAQEKPVLLWAKAAYLAAKWEWKDSINLIEDQLDEPGVPGGVFWNATCAYFNLADYPSALSAISKCTEREYRTSGIAWLARGLLGHLCGNAVIRNDSIREAIKIAPKQLVYDIGVLKQIGADVEGLPSSEESVEGGVIVEDEELVARYEAVVKRTRRLLESGEFTKQVAEHFAQFAPASITDLTEVRDTTFRPILLPTCPAQLYDYKEVFVSGVDAFRREAYEEASEKFAALYEKTDRNYVVAINLAASLILIERYSRAIDILQDAIQRRELGGANAIRNLISAFVRSGNLEEAFSLFSKLLEVSNQEYFNFVQMAYVAQLLARKEDVATALYSACTVNLTEPSIRLKGAAVKACLEVKDNDRAFALLRYFAKEGPLPYVVAGATRPSVQAKACKTYSQMRRQYEIFERNRDKRAALAYFGELLQARVADYGASVDENTVDALFDALMFYGESLFWNEELDRAHDTLSQALGILEDHSEYYVREQLPIRYRALTEIYFERKHHFWALELCERGLEADKDNKALQRLHGQIKQRIGQIPEESREALRELAELPASRVEKAGDFLEVLPKVSQIVQPLSQDFPASRKAIGDLVELINAVLSIETITLVDRGREVSRLRETVAKIEGDLSLYLPKASISALLPVLKGIRKTLDEVQAKSICPEFTFAVEPASYYRENEASLVYKLRNTGRADIRELRITMESESPHRWVPVLAEHSLDLVKKDELFWVDWPVHLEQPPEPGTGITPKVTLRFTGGSLRGEAVEQKISDQDTKLLPFIDINVDYPVIALKPEEGNKLYGRENLLRILKNSFTRSGQTRIPFIEGVRKVGKTSIFYFLRARIGDNLLPVYVNLDTTWTNPFQLLARRIGDEVVSRIGVEWRDLDRVVTRDDFDRFLTDVMRGTGVRRVVLLLDEFHAVIDRIEKGSLPSEFLGDLRYMYMSYEQKISVAFADWHLIDELKKRVPAQLWTDFARETISFLNELDTREAILAPAKGSPLRFERDVISSIHYYTNGYPWHIQWICSELVNHLNTQKRYVAIPQDIDLIARRLLKEDRLFNEGVCRPERLDKDSQRVIYGVLEVLQESRQDIRTWFPRGTAASLRLPLDVNEKIIDLTKSEIFQEHEDGKQIRFCSPLHALWFETKRQKGVDIHGEPLEETVGGDQRPSLITIPENPAEEVRRRCDYLRHLKSRLRQALDDEHQVFKNVEMEDEWANASIVVRTRDAWRVFITALRDLLVNDMKSLLASWDDRRRYPDLTRQLHSIRLRRNVVEHTDSVEGKDEEERCCSEDIGKRFPTSVDDWLILQMKALDRLTKALEVTIEQIAKT